MIVREKVYSDVDQGLENLETIIHQQAAEVKFGDATGSP